MLVKVFLLITLIGVAFILTIVLLILTFKSKGKPLNKRYLLAFLSSLTILFISGTYLLVKVVLVGINYGENVINRAPDFLSTIAADILSPSYPMDTPQMKTLLILQPDSISIPGEYYTYAGFRDYYRMPLVYPYSMNAIDALEDGHIEDETGVRILIESNKATQMLHDITHFSFNNDILYAAIHGHFDTDTTYAVLHFQSKNIEKYNTKEEALFSAYRAGLDHNNSTWTIKEYYQRFSNYE